MPMRNTIWIVAAILLIPGCATYHPLPIEPAAVREALTPPPGSVLKVEAEKIQHPILKPVEIEPHKGLTPDAAAIIAVLIHPGLRAERDKRGIASAQLYQAGLLPDPQFSGSLDIPTAGTTGDTVNAFGLTLSYDVFSLITRGPMIDSAQAHASSVALDVAWQEWQVAEAAKQHTLRLSLLEHEMAVISEEENALQENYRTVLKGFDMHDQTLIDLSAARSSLERVHLSVLGIKQRIVQERFALNQAIGFPPEHEIHLRPGILPPGMAAIPPADQLTAGIADRRLDLLALKTGYNSQEAQVRVAILEQFPAVNIDLNEARDTGNVVTTGPAVTFTLPFFNRNRGSIAVERATRKQLYDEYISRFYDAESTIPQLRADLAELQAQIDATLSYLPSQEALVKTYHEALLQGNADVLSYYNARDELVTTRISLLDLNIQFVDQFVALEIAAGRYLEPAAGEQNQ